MWNNETVLKATGGMSNDIPFKATGVCINTRNIKKGDIFVAVDGGEKYLKEAFSKGAVCAIVPENIETDIKDKAIIKVSDTLKALQDLGQYKRNNTEAKFIAITGSVGKTGTRDMLAEVLSSQGETYASKENYNNHYGVPLTLANMPESTEFAVIELGMNHIGEISVLVQQVRPDVALITTIAECHIEFFKSIEQIAEAKSEIFEGLHGGAAIINKTSPCFDIMKKQAQKYTNRILSFGDTPNCDVMLTKCECFEDHSDIELQVRVADKINYTLPIPGEHIAINSCGVFTVLKALHIDLEAVIPAIENIKPNKGRGKKIKTITKNNKKITLIDEAYNASPKSMIAAIKTFSLIKKGRKILVIGDMLELGELSKELHLSIIPTIIKAGVDKVYCCGESMKFVYDELPDSFKGGYADNSENILHMVEKDLKNGDNLLIKGSNGSKMNLVIKYFS